jgi:hypothetical protein
MACAELPTESFPIIEGVVDDTLPETWTLPMPAIRSPKLALFEVTRSEFVLERSESALRSPTEGPYVVPSALRLVVAGTVTGTPFAAPMWPRVNAKANNGKRQTLIETVVNFF